MGMTEEKIYYVYKMSGHYYILDVKPIYEKVLFEGTIKECYEFVKKERIEMKRMPKYLYHYSSKENRLSILKNGLIGSHQGKWCIYLAENIDSWKSSSKDCYKISTKNLNVADFTSVDENLDEVLYWGKIDDKIMISKNDIELIEKELKENE